jgi:hypothetical protein
MDDEGNPVVPSAFLSVSMAIVLTVFMAEFQAMLAM